MTIEWGGFATVAGWLESFPREAVAGDARLSIVEAWVMSLLNRRDEAELALQNAASADYEGPLPDMASSVEASAVLLRAGFPWGDVGRMLVAARRAFELEGRHDSMWSVTVHVQLGWALVLSGDFEAARPYLLHAARVAPVTGQWLNAFGALCIPRRCRGGGRARRGGAMGSRITACPRPLRAAGRTRRWAMSSLEKAGRLKPNDC